MKQSAGRLGGILLAAYAWLGALPPAAAIESPSSYGEAARVDTPVLRVPLTRQPPTIDGVMEAGEWEDAAALSGFWYDYAQSDFRFLAPVQTQLQVYAAYDKDNLYIAYTSPVYPENSWLKARGRFPDVLSHPQYGMLWDDHLELEIRPYPDIARGFQLGLFRWDVNPIGAYCDWYWSTQGGQGMKWKSNAVVRSQADARRWIVEYAIPFTTFLHGNYLGKEDSGAPLVTVPPPDGTIFRAWFVRGIGGNGAFFNAFDNHVWNTTKTQLVFDARAPAFQINELGPVMDDVIDVQMTVKNHNTRSETVRLGFFVESAEGLIYSSYAAAELNDGLIELRPGERRELRLKQPFPGISRDGNVLWFDVRSAGQPAKILFRTRLIRFHSMEGGVAGTRTLEVQPGAADGRMITQEISFKERRLDVIETLRPPRKDFEFTWQFSPYAKRLSAIVDTGIHGASEEARRAVEAKLDIVRANEDEDPVAEARVPFIGRFACVVLDLPQLIDGERYKVGLLLFDENRRIVGERPPEEFAYNVEPWQNNPIGKNDTVWEPFTPIVVTADGFETLCHRFTLAPSGLPAQITIKPDPRDLPLERRQPGAVLADEELLAIGRGPQLREPMRLGVVADGKLLPAEVVTPAKAVRTAKSEIEYESALRAGPLRIALTVRYDCDGSMHASMTYGAETPATVERFELVMAPAGRVDLALSETGDGGMTGTDRWECSLPMRPGLVWESASTQMELFYNKFVPWFWFGSADRAWSWYCDSDAGWILDREGSSLTLERDEAGDTTWRALFINHAAEVSGERRIAFALLTHPAKPKPADFRTADWHYLAGTAWADGYAIEPLELPEPYLLKRWRTAASAPPDLPDDQRTVWRKDEPPFHRYGRWRNVGVCPELDQIWEDKATYYFEQHIRIGRRVGWWMDEYFPVGFGRSDNLAMGNARLRRPEEIQGDELPWHSGFLTTNMRNHYKRLARVFADNGVPQRQHTWSNNAATMLESFIWNSLLVEECGGGNRAYEVDLLTQFPNSLYRFMGKNWTGLVTTLCADATPCRAGDDKRLDRQRLGIGLLHDFGVTPNGPHGTLHHKEQAVRLLHELTRFGFFDDARVEKLPFWRNREVVRLGDAAPEDSRLYVTVYRHPRPEGKGANALFVILNESLKDAELPLTIADPARLGGPNRLTAAAALAQAAPPDALADWWREVTSDAAEHIVLRDIETGDVVARQNPETETYGPVYVPYHDYRVLYGEFRTE